MEVNETEEIKKYKVFSTDSHRFKISSAKLAELEEEEKYYVKLAMLIQKSMKQIVRKSDGKKWEASWLAIFKEITGQETIDWK